MLSLLAVVVLLTILPFHVLLLLSGISLATRAEPAYVNGLITANGIFLGVIISTVMSKGKELGLSMVLFLFLPTAVFLSVIYAIFQNMVRGNVTVSDLTLLAASFLFSVLFFWAYLGKQFEERRVESP